MLYSRAELEENRDIKPFFEAHTELAAYLGSYSRDLIRYHLLAYQYQLFGDFACDVVVGDSQHQAYGFVEREEATSASIFRRQGRKATLEWSNCFERGLSQLIDWFSKRDDVALSNEFEARFGRRQAPYFGLLVIGRSSALTEKRAQQRWEWRRGKLLVNSLPITQVT